MDSEPPGKCCRSPLPQIPSVSAINAYLDLADASVTCESYACDGNKPVDLRIGRWVV